MAFVQFPTQRKTIEKAEEMATQATVQSGISQRSSYHSRDGTRLHNSRLNEKKAKSERERERDLSVQVVVELAPGPPYPSEITVFELHYSAEQPCISDVRALKRREVTPHSPPRVYDSSLVPEAR
ncbi:unnamed protein product [Pleuronectes platessa]|uniref:Uncharacterized protein n=1 Tax=Pleuronectes platessa TaxID=8262 RepID=A0A9N7TPG6_PLEPL|nr:unnamed protein product [Pleuronectes platessa]